MSGKLLSVRMTELPATVVGPNTRWFLQVKHYGKNGKSAALMARCLSNGIAVIMCDNRRENVTDHMVRTGFFVTIGTIQCKIASAAVAQGVAEFVDERAQFTGCV